MEIVQPGGSGGSSLMLETNGVLNGDQNLLNLVAGSNVTLTDNGLGSVTIASSGGGGGSPGGVQYDVQLNDGSGGFAGSNNLNFQGGYLTINGDSGYGQLQFLNSPTTGGYAGAGISGIDDQIIVGGAAGDMNFWSTQAMNFSADSGATNMLRINTDGTINIFNAISDTSNALSIDANRRQLKNNLGQAMVDWQLAQLNDSPTGTGIFNWQPQTINPGAHYWMNDLAILQGDGSGLTDVAALILKSDNASTYGTWGFEPSGLGSWKPSANYYLASNNEQNYFGDFGFHGSVVQDLSSTTSQNWDTRILYGADGTTPLINWTGTAAAAPISFSSGLVRISNTYNLPSADGMGGQFLGSDNAGTPSWQYVPYLGGFSGAGALYGDMSQNGYWRPNVDDKVSSNNQSNYYDNSGFHGDGSGLTGVTATNANYLYDTAGTPLLSADGVNRQLISSDGSTPYLEWSGSYPTISHGISIGNAGTRFNDDILDTSNVVSANVSDRILYDASGSGNSVDYNARILYGADGTTKIISYTNSYDGSATLSFQGGNPFFSVGIASSNSNTVALDTNNRILYAFDGTDPIIDWHTDSTNTGTAAYWFNSTYGNRLTGDGSGLTGVTASFATNANNLYDGSLGIISIDGVNRILYAPDGTTKLIDWTNSYNSSSLISFNSGTLVINGVVKDSTANDTWDTLNRWLYASDGSTIIFDYRTGTTNGAAAAYWFDSANGNRITGDGSGLTALDPANITGYTASVNDVLHGDSSWGPVDLAAGVTGILPVANGGTGSSTVVFPKVVASVFETPETGSDANVLTYTVGGTDEFLTVAVPVDVSALTGTSVVVTITWTDSNNAVQTSNVTLSGVGDGFLDIPINAKTATSVVVSTVFIGISTAYNISAVITRYL